MSGRKDLVWIHTKPFWFTVAKYDEPEWNIRRLSYPRPDRWAIDCGLISFIFEFWGWKRVRKTI